MTKIEQLEQELSESLNTQYLLRETLKSNSKVLEEIKNQLEGIEDHLKYSNQYITLLKQENRRLKASCDEWVKRAIQLEFKVLSAHDATKK